MAETDRAGVVIVTESSCGLGRRTAQMLVLPADTTRLAPYGPALDHYQAAREAAGAASPPGDPQEVADAIAALITMPAGQRPLRTVVAPTEMERQKAQAINEAVAEVQQGFLSAFGLEALVAR